MDAAMGETAPCPAIARALLIAAAARVVPAAALTAAAVAVFTAVAVAPTVAAAVPTVAAAIASISARVELLFLIRVYPCSSAANNPVEMFQVLAADEPR
jgi:hypothetical protein